jgi:BlaI family transcriptional regulator, penicillinase repressor
MTAPATPSELELKILQALWRQGPGTARELLDRVKDGKTRAYTTVLTTLQIMERKGFVTRTREGISDRWRATMKERKAMNGFWNKLVARVCGGRPSIAVQHLLDVAALDESELIEMERIIRDYREKNR